MTRTDAGTELTWGEVQEAYPYLNARAVHRWMPVVRPGYQRTGSGTRVRYTDLELRMMETLRRVNLSLAAGDEMAAGRRGLNADVREVLVGQWLSGLRIALYRTEDGLCALSVRLVDSQVAT